jgi:CxxC motif-containing protein (DUF1111 family)
MKKYFIVLSLFTTVIICTNYLSSCKKNDVETPPTVLAAEEGEEYSGGRKATSFDFSENAFGKEVAGLNNADLDNFVVGNSFFRNNWVTAPASATARDGVGALFNSLSCGGCHNKDGRAAPPETPSAALNGILFRISIPGVNAFGAPLAEPNYGVQLNNRAILGVMPEGYVSVTYTEVAGTFNDGITYTLRKPTYTFTNLNYGALHASFMYSPRIANQVMGLGLLEAIPEQTINSFTDETDANNDGISGRANRVWNFKTNQVEMGRFGWKANQPNIFQQTATAFIGDIGITSSLFPTENLTTAQQTLYANIPNGGTPEIEDVNLNRVIFYMKTLAVPGRRNVSDATVLKGKQLFNKINCSGCHKPAMTTQSSIDQLNNQLIRPYTDLLLHDMGDGLADNRPDYIATGNEWRTPPLWGLGLIRTVNGHTFLLHDGRARNMEEAILWHGGEATKSVNGYKQLTATERNSILKFMESL